MRINWKCALFVLLAVLCSTALFAAVIGAEPKKLSFDPKTGSTVIAVTNISNKDITAFNVSVDAVYANGRKVHSERLVDFLPRMISKSEAGDAAPAAGALHPGGGEEERISSSPSLPDGTQLDNVDVTIDVVLYADNTATVHNRAAFDRIVSTRRARATTTNRIVAILRKHLSPSEGDPIGASSRELTQLLLQARARPEELLDTDVLATMDDLQHAPQSSNKRDFLSQYAARMQQRGALAGASLQVEVQE